MPVTLEAFGLDKLSDDDKSELVALLRLSVTTESEFVVTPAQQAELERRVAFARANPGQGTPLSEVAEKLRRGHEARA